jgi:uroporphyrinogen-III decarboxylase
MLRADSAMNLSKDMYRQFSQPYDQRLMDEFGGGAIHFCGKGDHYISEMAKINGLRAINLSQPHLNRMETIYIHTIDRGINLIGLSRGTAQAALDAGRDLHGRVQVS